MPRKKSTTPKEKPPKELILAAHLPEDPAELLAHCTAGSTYIYANPAKFPSPSPAATALNLVLAALSSALSAAPGGSPADKKAVKAAAKNVRTNWGQLLQYAEGVLRGVAPADVPPILANCMMYVSNAGAHKPKPPLAAEHAGVSGSVILIALAIAGALTYEWQWSLDQVTWSNSRSGESRTTISGLIPGKQYWFRVSAFIRGNTTTDPVGPVSLIVI
jgi:hypothetical protein